MLFWWGKEITEPLYTVKVFQYTNILCVYYIGKCEIPKKIRNTI